MNFETAILIVGTLAALASSGAAILGHRNIRHRISDAGKKRQLRALDVRLPDGRTVHLDVQTDDATFGSLKEAIEKESIILSDTTGGSLAGGT